MKSEQSKSVKQRQILLSTLAKSSLNDIKHYWQGRLENEEYEVIRQPQTGMVMAVARAGSNGEPFNFGEVTVTRCAIRIKSGETGVAYVRGGNNNHALHIAVLDALAQTTEQHEIIHNEVVKPLQEILLLVKKQKREKAEKTKVEFFTMVRGED